MLHACVVKCVAMKIFFVPSTPFVTNVISAGFPSPPNRLMKFAKKIKSKRLIQFLEDFVFAMKVLSDSEYRFNNQDRIIMQGQDRRKLEGGSHFRDLKPTVSDNGVRTFQKWIQSYGNGGPFPFSNEKQFAFGSNNMFDGDLSIWESQGKFNPKIQRILDFTVKLHRISQKSVKYFFTSGILCNLISHSMARVVSTLLISCGFGALLAKNWAHDVIRKLMGEGTNTREIVDVPTWN